MKGKGGRPDLVKPGARRVGLYLGIYDPTHPRANHGSRVLEHIVIAETALGRALPKGVEVHHVNGDRHDNAPNNLVICQDRSYHQLLHQRTKAFKATGNARARKCTHCQQWETDLTKIVVRVKPNFAYHRKCKNKYYQDQRDAAWASSKII